MANLNKLKNELSRCASEIKRLKEKEKDLEEKIKLEEQREIQKLMQQYHISMEELSIMIENKK